MISIKAKKYLSSSAMNPESLLAQDQDYVWREESIIKAIEIAENEVVEKALEAYKYECICNFDGYCRELGCKVKCNGSCQEYEEFKQKLMEGSL